MARVFKFSTRAYWVVAAAITVGLLALTLTLTTGRAPYTPVEIYWPLVIGVCLWAATDRVAAPIRKAEQARAQLQLELSRRERCADMKPAEQSEYAAQFLAILYSLANGDHSWVRVQDILARLKHDCTPELLSPTLSTWMDKGFIQLRRNGKDFEQATVLVTREGLEFRSHAKRIGLQDALQELERHLHEQRKRERERETRCREQTEVQKAEYASAVFCAICALTRDAAGYVELGDLSSHLNHECTPELLDRTLELWRARGLISVSRKGEGGRFGDIFDSMTIQGPLVLTIAVTTKGRAVRDLTAAVGSLDAAVVEHDRQQREEQDRQRRCSEAAPWRRQEFENEFLQALHRVTAGDTARRVPLGRVIAALNDECGNELTAHAVTVWTKSNDMWAATRDVKLLSPATEVSITPGGRDLCERVQRLGTMQAALSERREGVSVTYFDNRNQQIGNQTNIGGNVGALNMGAVSDRMELVGKLEKLKSLLAETAGDQSLDEETVIDVEYQLTKAIGAAKKPEPEKSTILSHLGQAKSLLEATGAAAGVITAFAQATDAVQKLF